MAHIISKISTGTRLSKRLNVLSCMKNSKRNLKDIYNSELIEQKINEAARVRQSLEKEITERSENILKCGDANKHLDRVF